jgi:F-type H+-transporting ATPase subunit b
MEELLHDNTFWFAVSFVLFIAIAYPLGRKPVAAVFDGYAAKVRAELDEAARLRRETEELLASMKTRQHQARQDAEDMLKQAAEQAATMREQGEKELQASLKRREAQANDRIKMLEDQARAEISAYAATRALRAAEDVLKSHFSANDDQALIERQIKQLGKAS